MHAPAVHVHRLELGGHARVKDALLHVIGDTVAVVEHDERAHATLDRGCHEDLVRACVARVAQHLDDDVLDAADIMLGLAPLGLGDTKADESLAEVLLDTQNGFASHGGDEAHEVL